MNRLISLKYQMKLAKVCSQCYFERMKQVITMFISDKTKASRDINDLNCDIKNR